MRLALLFALLCSPAVAQEKFVVSETLPSPTQEQLQPQSIESAAFVIDQQGAAPPVSVDEIHKALSGILALPTVPAAPALREIIVYTPPPSSGIRQCGACDWMKQWAGTSITGAVVRYQPGGNGPWPEVRLADVPNDPKTGQPLVWHAALNRQQLEQYLAKYPAPVGTITVGSMQGKEQVAQLLQTLNKVGPGEVTVSWKLTKKPQIGNASASLDVATNGTATYRWSANQMDLEFKPPLNMVAGSWLKVGQPVSGVTVTRDKLTVVMPGMIDLAKTLK